MTQEGKAKAYDKVREKIAIRFGSNVADEIFSQFEMSEDERIRKEIIVHIKWCEDNGYCAKEEMTRWINWLEKQGEKSIKASYTTIVETGNGSINAVVKRDLSADKVEPKFKVGDWVVYNRDNYSREIIQVYDIRDGRYYFTDNVHFSWSIKECDEKSHLWTIQDAKDGDVLYCESSGIEYIIILKQINNRSLDSYCRYNTIDGFAIDVPRVMSIQDNPKPATKEQRDTLMEAMADAGWEFDFEKKELKKIEQKPAWSEEDERMMMFCCDYLDDNQESWLKSLKDRIGG